MTNINFHQTIHPPSVTLPLCLFPQLQAPGTQRGAIWSLGPSFTATTGLFSDAWFKKKRMRWQNNEVATKDNYERLHCKWWGVQVEDVAPVVRSMSPKLRRWIKPHIVHILRQISNNTHPPYNLKLMFSLVHDFTSNSLKVDPLDFGTGANSGIVCFQFQVWGVKVSDLLYILILLL